MILLRVSVNSDSEIVPSVRYIKNDLTYTFFQNCQIIRIRIHINSEIADSQTPLCQFFGILFPIFYEIPRRHDTSPSLPKNSFIFIFPTCKANSNTILKHIQSWLEIKKIKYATNEIRACIHPAN